jgi:hypothetical protein
MQENAYHPITHVRLGLAIENDGFAIVENCVDESTINQQCVSLDGNTHGQRICWVFRRSANSRPQNLCAASSRRFLVRIVVP